MARTARSLRVTFNLRYAPFATKVRQLVAGGAIGQPTSADLSWMLDRARPPRQHLADDAWTAAPAYTAFRDR